MIRWAHALPVSWGNVDVSTCPRPSCTLTATAWDRSLTGMHAGMAMRVGTAVRALWVIPSYMRRSSPMMSLHRLRTQEAR